MSEAFIEMDLSENSKPTQCGRILKYLRDFHSITPLQAMRDLGVMRLAARCHELRNDGIPITSTTVKDKNRYGDSIHYTQYSLTGG